MLAAVVFAAIPILNCLVAATVLVAYTAAVALAPAIMAASRAAFRSFAIMLADGA